MIKVNRKPTQVEEVFTPEGKSLGLLNDIEFIDLRTQIAANQAEGYYIMFNDIPIAIDSLGHLSHWPAGLFDDVEIALCKFFNIKQERKKK